MQEYGFGVKLVAMVRVRAGDEPSADGGIGSMSMDKPRFCRKLVPAKTNHTDGGDDSSCYRTGRG
jgi:hypothetical protein